MRGKSVWLCLLSALLILSCSACAVPSPPDEPVSQEVLAVREQALRIQRETGITVHTDPNEDIEPASPSFTFVRAYREEELAAVLAETEAILARFPQPLWKEIEARTGEAIHLYFVSGILAADSGGTEGQAMLYENGCLNLLIPSTTAFHLSHELMHLMERAMARDAAVYTEQNERFCALNPDGFSYGATVDYAYTLFNAPEEKVFFWDLYSKTDAIEDRAELFKGLMDYDPEILYKPVELCPGLRAKAEQLCAMLRDGFTCLKDAENLPWEKALQ